MYTDIQPLQIILAQAARLMELDPKLIRNKFTPRQKEVFKYLKLGFSNKDIGEMLGLGERTIKAHIRGMCIKLAIPVSQGSSRIRIIIKSGELVKKATGGKVYFTRKEVKILDELLEGKSNSTIAKELPRELRGMVTKRNDCTEQGLKNYMRQIFDKMGCSSRLEAAIWWYEHKDEALLYSASFWNGSKRNILETRST